MPWIRPTLKQLHDRISADFSARLLDGSPLPQRSVISVLSKVWAGIAHMFHGFLEWLYKQVFADTAEGEYLERWANVWGIIRKQASFASGKAVFKGAVGVVIPQGTLLTHKTTGKQYATTKQALLEDTQVEVEIVALEAGTSSNLSPATPLSLISPIAALQSTGNTGEAGITGGYEAEEDKSLRSRLLTRLRNPPRGGSKTDYITWALEVPGVTRAWCYPLGEGIGTVGLTFVTDNALTGPISSEEMVKRVKEHIEPLRPASVKNVEVFAPEPLEITISLSITPDTLEIRKGVEAELKDLITREGRPDSLLLLSHIHEALSLVEGENDHVLYDPTQNIEIPSGYFPILKEITFQAGT